MAEEKLAVELHHAQPREKLGDRLWPLMENASAVHVAVAFVGKTGVDLIRKIAGRLQGRAKPSLVVSVLFPTDLVALDRLAKDSEVDIFIHLGFSEGPQENEFGQFHSKLILIERANKERLIVIGSHNWTRNGLTGGNLEASVLITCHEGDAILKESRQHIEACKQEPCVPFGRYPLEYYQELQRKYHPHPFGYPNSQMPSRRKRPTTRRVDCPGFTRNPALVIRAKDHTDGKLAESGRVFVRIPADWGKEKPVIGTHALLYLFEKDRLRETRSNRVDAIRLTGSVEATSQDPELLRATSADFFINDLEDARLRSIPKEILPRLQNRQQWAVIRFVKQAERVLMPLFHVGEKAPGWIVRGEGRSDSRKPDVTVYQGAPEVTPTFQVPNWYAGSAERAVENYYRQQADDADDVELRVKFEVAEHEVGACVCFVYFQSDAALTQAIYALEA